MLLLAVDLFPALKGELYDLALKIGDKMWKTIKPFVTNSIPYDVAGCGYMAHCLYHALMKASKEDTSLAKKAHMWRVRSHIIARDLVFLEEKFAAEKDKPFVLKEALAGNICYLSDILCGDDHVKFPAYEI